ncbi:GNAT family N-acetyltransferase [Roseobacter sp. YSTF-M11]|uniref:GNAT family N-acetyltransferase n=1 Tax=Roseobacter insulae TaxID=2859783 RepID=A0A9X1K428_9RHOB|nr:GNAT family N-acetyltransferase [Roseobacter insulae]MBW4709287.1 GNAT family N-acetyltransferase [Roseobacter insulae]
MKLDTPTLQTDRLILRGPKPSDVDTFMAFYATERSQFTGGPMTPRQAWNFFGTEIGHWVIHGFGMFVVTRRGSDAPLGIVGHWYPHGWPEKEVGWVLFDAASEGQGIAREAAEACIDHAWHVLGWDTIVSYIAVDNHASVALAERLGATLDPEAVQPKPETPGLVYRHPRPKGATE